MSDRTVTRHHDLAAGDLAGFDVAGAQVLVDARQAGRIHAGGVGIDLHGSSLP
jgi:hypothetical protein